MEAKDYHERLRMAGVETEYLELTGCFHGMFSMASKSGKEESVVKLWDSFEKFALRYTTTTTTTSSSSMT